jgi:tripartite-type tricarboxylate transporter receptor subunit TctC
VSIVDIAASPFVLAVQPAFPAKNFKDFIAEVRKNPGRYTYASPGVGGIVHLLMEYFCGLSGTSIRHVPFKGAGPALTAVVGGQVDMVYDTPPSVLPFIKNGQLVPLVVSSPERWRDLPDLPTFREVGIDRMTRMPDFGLLGPKGLPPDIVARINAATLKSLEDTAVRKRIEDSGAVILGSTPGEYGASIKSLLAELKTVVADRKLTMD